MQAIIFALISYVGWGTGDIFGAVASRKIGAYSTSFWVFITGFLLFSLYLPFELANLAKLTPQIVLMALLLGLLYISGNVTFNEALRVSNASLVGTIAASFTAVAVVLSLIFLNETISIYQAIAIVIIFLGVLFATFDIRELKQGNLWKDKGIFYALYSMISWGIYFTFVKLLINQIGWFLPSYIAFALFPLIYLYMKIKKIPLEKPTAKGSLGPIVASALLLRGGDFSFNYAIGKGLTSIVAPIAGAYPTLFALLGFTVFKDPITTQQKVGIFVTLAGIVILSVLSS